jgi:hypothetical protein
MVRLFLENGASAVITVEQFMKWCETASRWEHRECERNEKSKLTYFGRRVEQPLEAAVKKGNMEMVRVLSESGASVDLAPRTSYDSWDYRE